MDFLIFGIFRGNLPLRIYLEQRLGRGGRGKRQKEEGWRPAKRARRSRGARGWAGGWEGLGGVFVAAAVLVDGSA